MFEHTITFTSDRESDSEAVKASIKDQYQPVDFQHEVEKVAPVFVPGDVVLFEETTGFEGDGRPPGRILTAVRFDTFDDFHWMDSEGDVRPDDSVIPNITRIIVQNGVVQE